MVRIIDSNVQSRTVSSYFPGVQIAIIGAILGLVFWGLNSVIGRYIGAANVPGDIATILVATIGLVVLITMRMPRPIVIALSSAVTLWGLASWTSSLSLGETIAWEVALYTLAYVSFSWVARYSKLVPVIIFAAVVVIVSRIAVSL